MRLKPAAIAVTAIALALALWAFWIEPDSLRVRSYDLPLQRWPATQTGLRIAVLADIHAGAPYIDDAKLQRICDLTNAAHPDLILHTGDVVLGDMPFGRRMTPEHIASALSCLHAPLGSYAVLGNNDHYNDADAITAAWQAHGVTVLSNRVLRIAQGAHQFWLMGLDDGPRGERKINSLVAEITDDAPVIALTHEPYFFPKIPPRVNLMVAGHTHGGQVWLPLLGRPALKDMDVQRYALGHFSEQTDLFVSSGIGTNNLAVRFGVPPEISLLVLRPAQ